MSGNDLKYFSEGLRKLIVLACVFVTVAVVGLIAWAYVRNSDAKARADVSEAEACTTIQDEVERSECVRAVD